MKKILEKECNFIEKFKNNLPGLLLVTIIGVSSRYFSNIIPNLGGVTIAIILGLIIGNLFEVNDKYTPGVYFGEKKLLSLAIMLMGLKLEMQILGELGISAILIIVVMVVSTIGLGFVYGRLLGLSSSFSLLLGIGNGICGSSAIGATAPLISSQEEEIGLSIGVVNLLGTLGIFFLPILTYLLKLTEIDSSLMIGGTLQAVGQVVAAGFSINEQVGRLSTIVKMGRILMLGPVILGLNLFAKQKDKEVKQRGSIPNFIVGFFILSLLGSLHLLPESVSDFLKDLSKILLTIAMAGVGIKIKVSNLLDQGPKALLVGILIFISQLSLITILIKCIF